MKYLSPMKYLSLCAIVKNEALYIEEWIKYHYALGVEGFYIFENESTDITYATLLALQQKYPIEVVKITGTAAQCKAYEQCLVMHKHGSRWIGFIDIDEFIVCKELDEFLVDFESFPAVAIHWKLFGSSGEKIYRPEPVVERFTHCEPSVNPHIKCFVDPTRALRYFTPHRFTHSSGVLVDEKKRAIPDHEVLQEGGSTDLAQVNHYATKSYEECKLRRSRPRADTGQTRIVDEFFAAHDRNEVEDTRARDFWRSIS